MYGALSLKGASHFLWLCGCSATSPPFEEVRPTPAFEAALDGEQGVGFGFRLAASCLTRKYGIHPSLDLVSPAWLAGIARILRSACRRAYRLSTRHFDCDIVSVLLTLEKTHDEAVLGA